jgi:hypothetical protein
MTATDADTKKRQRILRISKLNAWSITCIAGVFTLLGFLSLSLVGVIVGAAVTCAGLAEIKGHRRLSEGKAGARMWMSGSQVWLVFSVLSYCGWRLYALDTTDPFAMLGDSTSILELTSTMGISKAEVTKLFIKAYRWTYGLVAALTCVFQGGLSAYYWANIKH